MTDPELDVEAIWQRVYVQNPPTADSLRRWDVVTPEEAAAIWSHPVVHTKLVQIALGLEAQLVKGYRCGVCGMTQAQAEEAGYDCAYEC